MEEEKMSYIGTPTLNPKWRKGGIPKHWELTLDTDWGASDVYEYLQVVAGLSQQWGVKFQEEEAWAMLVGHIGVEEDESDEDESGSWVMAYMAIDFGTTVSIIAVWPEDNEDSEWGGIHYRVDAFKAIGDDYALCPETVLECLNATKGNKVYWKEGHM
jgi:hypothetical protein